MGKLDQALNDYEASLTPPTWNAYLGAFVAGSFQTRVATDPSLTYVRYIDSGTVTTAKHRSRINLDTGLQWIAIELGNERGALSVLDFDHNQAGAVLEADPAASVPAHTHDGADIVSGTVAAARLGVMTGDSGSGGAKGAVPAPGIGDALAGKFLKASGAWAVPGGTGGGGGSTSLIFVGNDSVNVSNTTTPTSIFPTGLGTLALPADWFVPGRLLHILMQGGIGFASPTPGTVTLEFGFFGNFTNTATMTGVAGDSYRWRFETDFLCLADGDSSTGDIANSAQLEMSALDGTPFLNLISIGAGGAFDTTVINTVDIQATWDTASASNSITSLVIITVSFADLA